MIDKDIVKNNFSKYAKHYDSHCSVQNLSALHLASKTELNQFKNILDIGCGTGNYTMLLRGSFPDAAITAVDISKEMIDVARGKLEYDNINFITADAETLSLSDRFDLISSNASFQWFDNLDKALYKYRELLKSDGIITFSIFGPLTYLELNGSLQQLYGEDAKTHSAGFSNKACIEDILRKGFKEVDIEEKIYKRKYDSLKQLLENIKYTGTRGNSNGNGKLWTAEKIKTLEKIYIERFGNIITTYQVFLCKGQVRT